MTFFQNFVQPRYIPFHFFKNLRLRAFGTKESRFENSLLIILQF